MTFFFDRLDPGETCSKFTKIRYLSFRVLCGFLCQLMHITSINNPKHLGKDVFHSHNDSCATATGYLVEMEGVGSGTFFIKSENVEKF